MPIEDDAILEGILCGLSLEADDSARGVILTGQGTRQAVLLTREQLLQLAPRLLQPVRLRGFAVWDGRTEELVAFGVTGVLDWGSGAHTPGAPVAHHFSYNQRSSSSPPQPGSP